jgi:hypothetical protein
MSPRHAGQRIGSPPPVSVRWRFAPQCWQKAAPSKSSPKQAGQLTVASRARQ